MGGGWRVLSVWCGDRDLLDFCPLCFLAPLSIALEGFLVSRAALESVSQHFVLPKVFFFGQMRFWRVFFNRSRLLVVCVAWCMAAGEQCASTSE